LDKRTAVRVAAGFAVVKLLVHLLTNGQYGYFRDELYYLATSEHLDWGYMDFAPMTAWVTWFARHVFGESLFGLRLLPAVAGALKVFLAGLIAVELGGGAFAAGLACLAALAAPVYLVNDTLLAMNAFEPVFWMGCVWLLIRIVKGGDPRLWLGAGALAGLGLLNKHSTAFFLAALGAGIVASRQRAMLRSGWPWAGAAVALLLCLPNVVWQAQHDFPTWEMLRNVQRTGKNVEVAPLEFMAQQVLILLPLSALVWGAGLWWLVARREGQRFRFLGWTYLFLLALMMALKAKHYYVAPVYPMLLAAGGVFWEEMRARWPSRAWWALPAAIAIAGVALAPLALPVLAPEKLLRYQEAIGIKPPKTEVGHAGPLPQHFGDMFGWPEMVEKVARAYHNLPAEERGKAGILTGNYGEAGAIDFFGPKHGLPKAISGHNNYYLWGPRGYTGEVLILLQSDRLEAERHCASVEDAGSVRHPWAMAEEDFEILVCRGARPPLGQVWPQLKHWD